MSIDNVLQQAVRKASPVSISNSVIIAVIGAVLYFNKDAIVQGSPLECAKAEYVNALNNMYDVGMGTPYSRAIIDVIPDLACGDLTGSQLTCAVIPGISVGI